MTDRELMQQGYEVPLVEQLDAVPRDARLWIKDSDGMGSRHFPIGLMCHKAAEALRARLSAPEPEREKGDMPCIEDDGCPTEKAVLQRFWRKHRQPEPEPVAWMTYESEHRLRSGGNHRGAVPVHQKSSREAKIPLYAAPPQREWQGLTDEEIKKEQHHIDWTNAHTYSKFARAIEAKLKEKNGG